MRDRAPLTSAGLLRWWLRRLSFGELARLAGRILISPRLLASAFRSAARLAWRRIRGSARVDADVQVPAMRTDRLVLRPLRVGDLDRVVASLAPHDAPEADVRDTLLEARFVLELIRSTHLWAFCVDGSDDAVGLIEVTPIDIDDATELEIGSRTVPSARGRGFASEAFGAITRHMVGLAGVGRVISLIEPSNAPSIRLAERAGMRYERSMTFGSTPVELYSTG